MNSVCKRLPTGREINSGIIVEPSENDVIWCRLRRQLYQHYDKFTPTEYPSFKLQYSLLYVLYVTVNDKLVYFFTFKLLFCHYHSSPLYFPGAVWACYKGCKCLPALKYSNSSDRNPLQRSQRHPIQHGALWSVTEPSDWAPLGLFVALWVSSVGWGNNIASVAAVTFIKFQSLQRLKELWAGGADKASAWLITVSESRTFENLDCLLKIALSSTAWCRG